jgi:trigger factor
MIEVREKSSEGLLKRFDVVLSASELEKRLSSQLDGLKDRVKINGFRQGKVPSGHLRRLYGRSVMAEVVQSAINEANQKIIDDNSLTLASAPKVDFGENESTLEKVLQSQEDLIFTVAVEVLPDFSLVDHSDIKLTRLIAEVTETDVDRVLEGIANRMKRFDDKPEGAEAQSGDEVVIDFIGRIKDVPFEGGKGEDVPLELGSGRFIPGFEDQLVGVKANGKRFVTVTFPEDYSAKNLAGQDAVFEVDVKAVKAPQPLVFDDAFAKQIGFDTLEDLRGLLRANLEKDFAAQSRLKVKKVLLDALDSRYSFSLPPSLVEQEFAGIWDQIETGMKQEGQSFPHDGKSEEEMRAEYQSIAHRRVRLGLVLSQIGKEAQVQITDEEFRQAMVARLKQFPGQEKQFYDRLRNDPQLQAAMRAPIFEEKVIDHILAQVQITDETVSREVLFVSDNEDE